MRPRTAGEIRIPELHRLAKFSITFLKICFITGLSYFSRVRNTLSDRLRYVRSWPMFNATHIPLLTVFYVWPRPKMMAEPTRSPSLTEPHLG